VKGKIRQRAAGLIKRLEEGLEGELQSRLADLETRIRAELAPYRRAVDDELDPVTYQFFTSQNVTLDESVCYYRIRPHRGVSHVTPQSSPLQRPVSVVSGGAGGAVAEDEGTGAAGAGGVGSGGVGVVVTPVEDTSASTRRPRPASPPGFPSVPEFPPHSSLRLVAAEPWGVPAGGTGGTGGVGGGGAGSGGAGAKDIGTVAPTPCIVRFLTREQHLFRLEREEWGRFERARQQQQQEQSQTHCQERIEEEPQPQQERVEEESQPQQERAEEGSRLWQQVQLQLQQERVEEELRLQHQMHLQSQQERVPLQQTPEEVEQQRQRDLPDPAPARLVRGPLPSPHVPLVESLSSSPWTRRSPLDCAVPPEPRRSCYRADEPFHLVLCSRVPPPPILPQPSESSLTVFHDPLSDYLRASRPVVSRVLFTLVTHLSGPRCLSQLLLPLSLALPLPTALTTPLTCLVSLRHLCAMLLALKGDPGPLDIMIPRTHAEAVSGP
ncbi:unnamed protein product, partial [Closterium sp. NIES-54]